MVRANYVIDAFIFAFFLIGFEFSLTGNAIHEWWNATFAVVVLLHLLMHGDWLVIITCRQHRRMSGILRINYVLDLLLLISFLIVVLSGLMISTTILGSPADALSHRSAWRELHSGFANFLLFLIGAHFALHWKWIVQTSARFLGLRPRQASQIGPAVSGLD